MRSTHPQRPQPLRRGEHGTTVGEYVMLAGLLAVVAVMAVAIATSTVTA